MKVKTLASEFRKLVKKVSQSYHYLNVCQTHSHKFKKQERESVFLNNRFANEWHKRSYKFNKPGKENVFLYYKFIKKKSHTFIEVKNERRRKRLFKLSIYK